jgi:hypothetical protein
VDVAIAERAGLPRGLTAWSAAAVRAAVDREASVALPGFNGQGEVWSASWRWWSNRPRVAVSLAAPRVAGLFGVWTVEGSWEAETYGATDRSGRQRTERTHGGLTVSDWLTGGVRYSISGGFDAWNDGRRAAAAGASMERRWFGDRVTVAGDVTAWFPLRDRSDGGRFTSAGAHAVVRSAQAARDWVSQGTVGTIRVSDTAPLTIWPGAGEGRARPQLLRAHPILDDGVIDVNQDSTFGRSIYFGSAEIQRWLPRPALVRVGAAAFVDVARATRRVSSVDGPAQVDVGGGLRIRVPGTPRVLRVDAAHGLRDGSNAVTIGWTF